MTRGRVIAFSLLAGGAAFLLGACAISGGVPTAIADAEPVPGGCPPKICPQHSPTQPPPPSDEPEPEPTATASKPGKPGKPAPRPTSSGGVIPAPGTTPIPGATTTASPATPGAPLAPPTNNRFAAFPFSAFPYDQAFPRDPPPAPAPLALPPPTGWVALAAGLAAGVAAATSMTARRRAWASTPMPGGIA